MFAGVGVSVTFLGKTQRSKAVKEFIFVMKFADSQSNVGNLI